MLARDLCDDGTVVYLECVSGYTDLSSVHSLSHVQLCDPMNRSTPGLPSITNSWSLLKLMSIESVMPSSHLILCHPLLLLPPIPPSIRVFSNESTLRIIYTYNKFTQNYRHTQISTYKLVKSEWGLWMVAMSSSWFWYCISYIRC